MNGSRFLTVLITFVLAFSVWGVPSSVYAGSAENPGGADVSFTVDAAKVKIASLIVTNRTGGTLYVRLSGPASYFFAATKQGKTTFTNITPGKYTIVLTASACGGSLTYTKKLSGKASLKPIVCRK